MSVREPGHRAADPGISAWVSANAGAGKTHVLTDRVTRLLLEGASPSRILCLTYTKAAAAEMASRLFERLGAWALLSDEKLIAALQEIGASDVGEEQLKSARRLFARALETPGGLKIQTIHSFCQHVLARFPVEADIPARFQVLDERSSNEMMAAARNAVLTRAGSESALGEAVAVLATRAPDRRFAEILDAAIGAQRGKLRDVLAKHGDDEQRLFEAVRATLGVAKDVEPDELTSRFCAELAKESALLKRTASWLLGGSTNDIKQGERLIDFINGGMSPRALESLADVFLTGEGEPRKTLVTAKTAAAKPDLADYLAKLCERFLAFENTRKAATTAMLTEALVKVADAVLVSYDRGKRARAALDYDDLTRATLALLEKKDAAAWVLYKLDGGLDHILVDEAQDTSPEQWRIVGKLVEDFFAGRGTRESEGELRTLFAVGDEKQSIFSFQGADPEAFVANVRKIETRAKGASFEFERVELAISRRGARAVLDFVDQVFESEAARDGLTFDGSKLRHIPHRKDVVGRVEVWPTIKPPPGEDDDEWEPGRAVDAPKPGAARLLAQRIAAHIAHWLKTKPVLPATGKTVQPGDIMILVRRRTAFAEEMIRALMERGIEVAGADRMKLADQIAIADLVALGRFALLPDDDLNLAALLKSPLIGFSEDDLFDLAYGREGKLWPVLVKRYEERPIFQQAYDVLSQALKQADRMPPFEFYSQALSRGMRNTLVARLGAEAADAIDEFLALALMHESAHPPSLESFLDWFGRGASDVKRDMEQGGQAVRVMTVHGAKGLQAPIVIVPDTTQIPNHAANAGLLFAGDCVFFGVNKALETPAVARAKAAAHAAEMREYRRLLYVALTRAQDWLVVCGYETKHGVNGESWYPFAQAAARAIGREEPDESGEIIFTIGADTTAFTTGKAAIEKSKPALPDFLKVAAPTEKPGRRVLQPSQAVGAEEPPVFSPFDDQGFRFRRGLLVHSLLAALPDVEPAAREQAALQFLMRRGVKEPEARALAAEAIAVLNHADFAALFTPTSRAEVPISVELPELGVGTRVSGQIDRLAVTAETVLVADYKTNRPPPARVEGVAPLYRAQMALYRAALNKIYPGKRIACALVWTDGPRLMQLPNALLDAEIAQITSRSVG